MIVQRPKIAPSKTLARLEWLSLRDEQMKSFIEAKQSDRLRLSSAQTGSFPTSVQMSGFLWKQDSVKRVFRPKAGVSSGVSCHTLTIKARSAKPKPVRTTTEFGCSVTRHEPIHIPSRNPSLFDRSS